MLNKNGILSFILPNNFLNCLYYNKTREYISNNFKIINIVQCKQLFIDTSQDTIIIIIQKAETLDVNKDFVLYKNKFCIFNTKENIEKLKILYKNSISLHDLNFKATIGTVVWNQVKENLTDDKSKTRLIYSTDIKNNILCEPLR